MRIEFDLNWRIRSGGLESSVEPLLFELLKTIRQGGNLRYAADACGVSYRKAWGKIEHWQTIFGTNLVNRERGRGTQLTAFAETLLAIKSETDRALHDPIASAGELASGRLTRMLESRGAALRLVTSHSTTMNQLAAALDRPYRRIVVDVIGSESALRRYQRADADVVGFHLPYAADAGGVSDRLLSRLDDDRDLIYYLQDRSLGLVSRPDIRIDSLEQLRDDGRRFINRQNGSATRLIFDALLSAANIKTTDIVGYADEEHTHTAVAALVASGDRDVGFAEASAARQFSLDFQPLVRERFYVAMKKELQSYLQQEIEAFFQSTSGSVFERQTTRELLAIHGAAGSRGATTAPEAFRQME